MPKISEFERCTLVALVEKYKGTLECKENNFRMIEKKNEGWRAVEQEFNDTVAGLSEHRSAAQLRKCWANIKAKAKKEVAVANRQKKATGGGPPPAEPSEEAMKIAEIIPQQFHSLGNIFDSDGML
ncbi:myb/SANT-like DNA-binding domain-containing protein 3 [Antedon mediterranea]|uniref:myb/SANT-like DNA-binding domain-containing protein 3 n=1 Tax=Antedon mediterranea TaxID=105859 RepID=UPI003AF90789